MVGVYRQSQARSAEFATNSKTIGILFCCQAVNITCEHFHTANTPVQFTVKATISDPSQFVKFHVLRGAKGGRDVASPQLGLDVPTKPCVI
jgi:uracil phosphoribosyltransferase